VLWGNVPADRSALNLVLPGGPWAWLFWIEWIVGGVIPLAFLLVPRLKKMPGALGLAAFLVIVGVYAFRIELVVLGFVNPLTQFPPGNAVGTYNVQTSSFQLIGIVIGLVALFAALITIGYRALHVMEPSPAGGHRHARMPAETKANS
jgi:Ni/Fe-hydrogenase subunit HybB-like protein